MRIITLCENRVLSGKLKAMHGLSLYIEIRNHKYIYDVGQEDIFLSNAQNLNIDLKRCEKIIISHGHYDHGLGLVNLGDLINKNNFIINKKAFKNKVRFKSDKTVKDIGIVGAVKHLEAFGMDIDKSFEIDKGVWCICNVLVPKEHKRVDVGLYVENENGSYELDDFQDEINLAVETKEGLVVISGCSHCGVINILEEAKKVTGVQRINTFVGGTHLINASKEEILKTADKLLELKVERLIIGHCTGVDTIALLKERCKDKVQVIHNYVGLEFEDKNLE